MEKEIRDKEKVERVLGIYTKLLDGIIVNKQKEAEKYGVVNRSIQRDIDNIRSYLAKTDNEKVFIIMFYMIIKEKVII